MVQSTSDFLSQQLTDLSTYLSRQPLFPTVFLVACAAARLGLGLFLFGARRALERQQRLHECRRYFDDDQGFPISEEKLLGPARSQSSWLETRREFGSKAGGHAQVASLKSDLPPFHVPGHL